MGWCRVFPKRDTAFFLRLNKVMELLSTVSLPHRYISPASALYWSVFLGSKLALPPFFHISELFQWLFVCLLLAWVVG